MQKSQAFLYTNNRQPAKSKANSHNRYKENKIPRNTTNKGCKGPLQGELKTTAQGIRKDTNRWQKLEDFP